MTSGDRALASDYRLRVALSELNVRFFIAVLNSVLVLEKDHFAR